MLWKVHHIKLVNKAHLSLRCSRLWKDTGGSEQWWRTELDAAILEPLCWLSDYLLLEMDDTIYTGWHQYIDILICISILCFKDTQITAKHSKSAKIWSVIQNDTPNPKLLTSKHFPFPAFDFEAFSLSRKALKFEAISQRWSWNFEAYFFVCSTMAAPSLAMKASKLLFFPGLPSLSPSNSLMPMIKGLPRRQATSSFG